MAETRPILNSDGQQVGELTLDDGTSESQWAQALAPYAVPPPSPAAKLLLAQAKNIEIGKQLILGFAAKNIFAGLDALEIGPLVSQLLPIQVLLLQGNLASAKTLVDALTPSGPLTAELIAGLSAQLGAYTGT